MLRAAELTIYDLPSRTTLPVPMQYGYIPVGDQWLTSAELGQRFQQWNADLSTGGITDWLKRNATAVYITAGAALVLALFSGGRRR